MVYENMIFEFSVDLANVIRLAIWKWNINCSHETFLNESPILTWVVTIIKLQNQQSVWCMLMYYKQISIIQKEKGVNLE